ncbi:MAG: UvrD-helicase domain-containing protein [Bdellovibrionota bacterium]
MNKWTQGLNPEQGDAVNHNHGPLLILAGAGSGKTTVLVSRTGRLIDEKVAKAEEICVLTFTNKAARELKHRVQVKVGIKSKGLWAGTFHSFGLQLLRKNHKLCGLPAQFGILDQSDSQAVLKDLAKNLRNTTKDKFDFSKVLELVNQLRAKKTLPVELEEYHEMAMALMPGYEKELLRLGVVDFEGLLLEPLRLFNKHPEVLVHTQERFKQIMVDEFQDTNQEQMKLIRAISESHTNLSVVGDDDQSIYGWRGAEIQNILNFPKEFKNCQVIKLERNYRSSENILDLGNAVIAKNAKRHGKILRSEKAKKIEHQKPEVFVLDNEDDEADFVCREIQTIKAAGGKNRDIAVLYRSNTQGAFIETSLRKGQIPYSITGGTSIFDRKEAKDWLAFLKQSLNDDEVSFRRIVNLPPRGLGDNTLDKLMAYAEEVELNLPQASKKWDKAGLPEEKGKILDNLNEWLWTFPQRLLDDTSIGETMSKRFEFLVREIGYRDYLIKNSEGIAFEKKWQVVEIVGRILESFIGRREPSIGTLKDFVDSMQLRDDVGNEEVKDEVQLMTFHASKGLEFPNVILVGVEEDLLPHKRLGSDIDEERRLFYVGITRAQEKLTLSYCRQRKKQGVVRPVSPSRFLLEVDQSLVVCHEMGNRPVSADEREDLVKNFLAKFDSERKRP